MAPLAATFKTDTSIYHWLITRYCSFVYFWGSGKQR
ncbi:DNA-binding protein, partial [Bacteroides ovatus]